MITFRGGVFGTFSAPGHEVRAIPPNKDTAIADLTQLDDAGQYRYVEDVRKQLGPQFDSDLGLMLDIWRGAVSFSVSWDYTNHAKDSYSGTKNLYYGHLSSDTDSTTHAIEFSTEISSVPLYTSNRAPLPGKVVLSWYQPVGGHNSLFTPYGRFDLVLLF